MFHKTVSVYYINIRLTEKSLYTLKRTLCQAT
nr:MAG TPA: hypothetical protein [Caudoviricetes sp.]